MFPSACLVCRIDGQALATRAILRDLSGDIGTLHKILTAILNARFPLTSLRPFYFTRDTVNNSRRDFVVKNVRSIQWRRNQQL
jgi:hypothetical protein